MSNQNQINPKALQGLLNMASKKLNTTPDVLQKQLQDGTFEKALGNIPNNEANMLKQALSDPKKAEKILSTPQAQALYRKLNQGK